jgi:hypothetical protein
VSGNFVKPVEQAIGETLKAIEVEALGKRKCGEMVDLRNQALKKEKAVG